MSISVSYHDTLEKLQGLAGKNAGPFHRPEWFALLAQHGYAPLVVVGESAHRRAAWVLQRSENGLESLTNWFSFTWAPHGRDDVLVDELHTAMARDLRGRTARVTLAPLAEEEGSAPRLAAAFRAGGWLTVLEPCDENHVLDVEGRSFADYWAYRPGRMRTTLKRKADKLDIALYTQFEEDIWQEYQSVYAHSWKPPEERADLLEAFARAESEAGHFRLGIARAEGRAVAAQFWTVEGGTAYIHKLAHLDEAAPLSAGTVLSAAMFERAIDRDRVAQIDFGTGSDAYKRDWMERVRTRFRLTAYDWRSPRVWPALGKAALRRLARGLGRS